MTKLHFISLGCPKNLVDSEVMLGQLVHAGFVLTENPSDAEAIVINTCAFIEDARKEAIDTILEMTEFKKKGRCRLIAVAGCLPQRYKNEIKKLLPEVDIFIGAGEFHRIAGFMKDWESGQEVHVGKPTYIYDHESPRIHITPSHVAYLKIAEGCFHPCSFCAVPKIRGAYRSRSIESIVEEARGMLDRGVCELNLIGQDTTAFGRDTGENITELLERLSDIGGEKWIRLFYAYPHDFPEELIRVMWYHPDICKYLDIPIQHISDRILKSMKRKGTGREIRSLIEKLRRELPEVSLRTSLIVGFPGETDEEFDELLDFVCEMRFEHMGVFVFSPEEGTQASKLRPQVPRKIAQERRREIMDVQRELSLGNNQRMVGRQLTVLAEGYSPETNFLYQGRHEGQAPEIDGLVYINDDPFGVLKSGAGKFVEAVITEAHDYDLVGRVVG